MLPFIKKEGLLKVELLAQRHEPQVIEDYSHALKMEWSHPRWILKLLENSDSFFFFSFHLLLNGIVYNFYAMPMQPLYFGSC